NWVALFVFLAVAVFASNLSAAAQDRARDALERRREMARLFDLSRDVLLTSDGMDAHDTIARHIARRFELSRVALCLPSGHGWTIHQGADTALTINVAQLDATFASTRGRLEFDARQRTYGGHAHLDGPDGAISLVPLRLGTRAIGLLAAIEDDLEAGTLDAIAGLAAIAIERAQFVRERESAERVRQKADLTATLLASISHDLRTPLTAIRVAIENLQAEGIPPENRREQAGPALVELDRRTRLFQDILEMASIDADAIQIERHWVTPADIVDAAAAHVRHALSGRRLDIHADGETEVELDPRLTSAALAHLLENAAQ